jgi:hypothetical protein
MRTSSKPAERSRGTSVRGSEGVDEVLVPGEQHALGAGGVMRVKRDRCPVDVPDDHPAARSQGSVYLPERRGRIADVLEHLHAA